jgi:uncharacterized protein
MTAVAKVAGLVQKHLENEGSGHDWEHIRRVWQTAARLAAEEKADAELVELAALLHDVDDAKLTGDLATEITLPTARRFMAGADVPATRAESVCAILKASGYHKSLDGDGAKTLEAHILSDADYLDAMGAIGIARAFAYGGNKGRPLFEPAAIPREHISRAEYVSTTTNSISHFFEKILRLRDKITTAAGKAEAARRHARMLRYLEDFFDETAAPPEWRQRLDAYRP